MNQGRQVELRPRCPCLTHWPPLPPPPTPMSLPAAPCGQQLCSTPLSSIPLSSAPGRPPPPCPPPPLLLLSPLTALALRGWGPQGWTHPTVAREPSWSDRHTVGRRTPEPRGGQCARVPHSLLKVSASQGCSYSGVLKTFGVCPRPLIPDLRPQSRFSPQVYLRQAGPVDRGDPCVHRWYRSENLWERSWAGGQP